MQILYIQMSIQIIFSNITAYDKYILYWKYRNYLFLQIDLKKNIKKIFQDPCNNGSTSGLRDTDVWQ